MSRSFRATGVNLLLRKEDWYHKAVEHVWATLQKLNEVPPEAKDTAQERLYFGRKNSFDSWWILKNLSTYTLNLGCSCRALCTASRPCEV